MSLALIMASAIAATSPGSCSWAHPGANPYRADPTAALGDFAMSAETRRELSARMSAHRYTDVAMITRDDIVGQQRYGDLRDMHSGHGQTCHGAVDRSAWDAKRTERGLVYCVGDTCVIVPTICNNVSLVTRRPDEAAQDAEAPIDIAPAAGAAPPADAPPTLAAGASPDDVIALPSSGDDMTFAGPAGSGGVQYPGAGGGGVGGPGPLGASPTPLPVRSPPTPVGPIATVPPVSAVPEPSVVSQMLAALVALAALRRRRPKPQAIAEATSSRSGAGS